jgi:hypothetical protein
MLAASFPKTSGRFGSFRIIIAHMLAFFSNSGCHNPTKSSTTVEHGH